MDDNSIQDIMVLLKRKLNHIEQIYNYALDMQKSSDQSDTEAVAMLLDMRHALMADVDKLNDQIEDKISLFNGSEKIRIKAQMSDNPISSEVSFEEGKINEIWNSIRSVLKKIIESDEKLRLKVEALSKLSSMDSI